MITIEGKSIKPGVAVAVAAVVESRTGINGVCPSILEEGLTALKRHTAPSDYPEAVIACDVLVMGVSLRIPGINTIAVVAESDAEIPGLEPEVPCVIGLRDLLRSISAGDIVIVDGGKGVVHIDPDPHTLVHYQEIENRQAVPTVYIASEHIPARTQDGRIVYVYARILNRAELQLALEEGADGLFVEPWGSDCYGSVLRAAAGKRVAFAVDEVDAELFRVAAELSVPRQVSVLFPVADLDARLGEAAAVLETAAQDARRADLAPPQISFGVRACASECAEMSKSAPLATEQGDDLDLAACLSGRTDPESVLVMIGERAEVLESLVGAGARSVVISPGLVRQCKEAIKTIGSEV